jgi:hypothetical protein
MPFTKDADGASTASNTRVVLTDAWAKTDHPSATATSCSGSTVCDFGNTAVTIVNMEKLTASTALSSIDVTFNNLPDMTANVINVLTGVTMGSFKVCKP